MAGGRYRALDALRGVCALTVLLFHCRALFFPGLTIFQHGYLAVEVFFLLSGFVIALTYEQRLLNGEMTMTGFLRRRGDRLLPTYWIGAILDVAAFVLLASLGLDFHHYTHWMIWLVVPVATFLLAPEYVTPDQWAFPATGGVAWSLFAEWVVNIAYAMGLMRLRMRWLLIIVAVCWSGDIVFSSLYSHQGWFFAVPRSQVVSASILRCVPAFLLGVVIYRVHRTRWFARLPVVPTELVLLTWVILAALPKPAVVAPFDVLIVMVWSPILVCLAVRSERAAPSYCKWLGDVSYPLYVVHPAIVMLACDTPLFGLGHGPNPVGGFAVVGVSLGTAWLVREIANDIMRHRTARSRAEPKLAEAKSAA